MREQCEGVNLTFPMTIPALDPNPIQSWKATLHSELITKQQVRNAYRLTTCKHPDAEIRDIILKFLTKKTICNAQIERAYPDHKPDWYTDPYCHTCKTERNINIPETLYHAVAYCDFVRDTVILCMSTFGILSFSPIDNSPKHSLLWSFHDKVLGPCQPLITKTTLTNALRWLILLEILNFRQEK